MEAKAGDITVPLAVLLKREMSNEKSEKPDLLHGEASQKKKGEDFTLLRAECERTQETGTTSFSVFGLFDGHNGSAAAIYTKEHLLNNVLNAIPPNVSRDEWISALPRALVAGFVKTDKDFTAQARSSGTTVTLVIIDGWVVTVASVGDSRCILESAEGSVYVLSADHRLEVNKEEVDRVTASGGEVARINIAGGASIGPLRCWPGGLCLSRSIGDLDVGEYIVPVPHVKQVKLSNAGGRLVIASDGVWDALSHEKALNCCRGLPAESAAARIVKEAVKPKGLRDDTTCIVVDILPPEKVSPPIKKPGKGGIKYIFRRKSSETLSEEHVDRGCSEPDVVEEMFEDGSAMLSQRLSTDHTTSNIFEPYNCAVCQLEMKPGEGISVHSTAIKPIGIRSPWDGPFLCVSCQEKKEAMEGKSSRNCRSGVPQEI
ncbi:hypothetical protein LUZ61_000855 [Rhynchospora tenuis]|uniref:protein-serine/threonine phosphatase n=1 Tax=Rhynchospora tenuis TaxID=198213 RepID=A0AAD6EQF8_9POAL|nr:hypothetical protein LUZ61_000855 [Rhynchospora tenuis]